MNKDFLTKTQKKAELSKTAKGRLSLSNAEDKYKDNTINYIEELLEKDIKDNSNGFHYLRYELDNLLYFKEHEYNNENKVLYDIAIDVIKGLIDELKNVDDLKRLYIF